MSRVGVFTGTFDPLTLGHLDLIARAVALCDRLVVGVSASAAKAPLFPLDRRVALVAEGAAAVSDRIAVYPFTGLAVEFAAAHGAAFVVRGLRHGTDFDYEAPMAAMNGAMAPAIDTLFLLARPAYAAIASSLVKDVARGRGAVELFVPPHVAAAIRGRLQEE